MNTAIDDITFAYVSRARRPRMETPLVAIGKAPRRDATFRRNGRQQTVCSSSAGVHPLPPIEGRIPRNAETPDRHGGFVVGDTGLEPVTSALSRRRSPS